MQALYEEDALLNNRFPMISSSIFAKTSPQLGPLPREDRVKPADDGNAISDAYDKYGLVAITPSSGLEAVAYMHLGIRPER
jgi:hypothetical protein